jgi:hypothetical protein
MSKTGSADYKVGQKRTITSRGRIVEFKVTSIRKSRKSRKSKKPASRRSTPRTSRRSSRRPSEYNLYVARRVPELIGQGRSSKAAMAQAAQEWQGLKGWGSAPQAAPAAPAASGWAWPWASTPEPTPAWDEPSPYALDEEGHPYSWSQRQLAGTSMQGDPSAMGSRSRHKRRSRRSRR